MPNEDSELVLFYERRSATLRNATKQSTDAAVVELIVFVDASSPYSYHVLVSFDEQFEPLSIPSFGRIRKERIERYPIRTSSKKWNIVDNEAEAGSRFILQRRLDDFETSECNLSLDGVEHDSELLHRKRVSSDLKWI